MRSYEATLETDDELAAINDMLAAIGESPVSSLEGDPNADVANARRILNQVNREVQSRGWTFNIEEGAVLSPDSFSGLIEYLSDYLRITTSGGTVYVNRGGYVYDRSTKTDVYTNDITVDLIRFKTFSEMPECFRSYIVAKASRRFNIRFFGAGEIEGSLQEQESEAWQQCQEYELDYGGFNMIDGDSYVGGIASR
ncbi:tail tubular protein A [Pseudomonas phage gh-1]|uniref:Tail tubular protein A n=9 Tax=Ghunavirus TaxID=2732683 RepID=A0A1W6JRU5_9CAUD|nr:tail protein [Pseudomonas phage gh-1]YP_009043263.1 tail protein [Pseudomonas phage phiPSA2]YP_009784781.1 tail protein [Pseudomonas phage phiPsa17]YP_009790472.1 tail protein [Pseudomonas phage WRT]YP_009790522.1 tail protein [Pseudomonas phage KNP]YP_009793770.1 tail protein [Pseudomonas phage Pf1 ERZ-2017]QHB47999.1 tail tubular protein A [Pseudomonas phage CHF19]QHB48047.1 tail tubular protein A [Pseudomonas phage CHF21]QHB48143.1 tail tubular protein A [Pseudomonas phage CHF17]QVD4